MLKGDEIAAVYNSNALEGNTLTLGETALVIEQGLTIGGKSLADHLEAIDHIEALRYVENLARDPDVLSQRTLREIHSLVLRRSNADAAGKYRDIPVTIGGTTYAPPGPLFVGERMAAVFERYVSHRDAEHPAIVAADLHQGIVDVHPFEDGNGRTARLAMNLHLLQRGFPLTIVAVTDREHYITALEAARNGSNAFREFIIKRVEISLKRYLTAIEPPAEGVNFSL